jgi:hypothetical protein
MLRPEKNAAAGTVWLVGKYSVRTSDGTLAVLNKVSYGYSQSFHADTRIVPRNVL